MTHRAFTPHLVLRPDGDGAVVLNAATLVPSGHFSAEPAVLGPPAGMAVVPEVFPVTLPLAYHEGVATQAFKLVRHGPLVLEGLNEAHRHVVAFVVLDDRILGQGSIGNPTYALASSFGAVRQAGGGEAGELSAMSWAAWVDNMPMSPRSLHVAGRILVPNPGTVPRLQRATPQGFNPTVLLMELVLHQLPGVWPQVVVPRDVDYVEHAYEEHHETIFIVSGGQHVASVEIEQVH